MINKGFINYNKKLRIWVSVNIVVYVLPFIIYYVQFNKLVISKNPSDWGDFASYINNALSPLLISFNIYFLIKLTYIVADYNQKNTGNQMRQSAYVEISKRLYSFASIIQSSEDINRDIDLLRYDIISFSNTMTHIFDIAKMTDVVQKIDNSLGKIIETSFIKDGLRQTEDSAEYREFILLCEVFDAHRVSFITKLQDAILDFDTKGL